MIVAIHQPNFIPWLGFFHKIFRSDKFILLDDVQFPKKGGNWTNRTTISLNNQRQWITVPIERNYEGTKPINQINILKNKIWHIKILKTLESQYSKALYFESTYKNLSKILSNKHDKLIDLNLEILYWLFELLGIDKSKIYLSSSFEINTNSTKRLIDLTKAIKGNTYLSGDGSSEYLEFEMFDENSLKLDFLNFEHPIYEQKNNKIFVSNLSIIDCLFNIGQDETIKLLKS